MRQISNPRWVRANMIDVDIENPAFGTIPYSCIDGSGEDEMQAIWDGLMRGDFGVIAGSPDQFQE